MAGRLVLYWPLLEVSPQSAFINGTFVCDYICVVESFSAGLGEGCVAVFGSRPEFKGLLEISASALGVPVEVRREGKAAAAAVVFYTKRTNANSAVFSVAAGALDCQAIKNHRLSIQRHFGPFYRRNQTLTALLSTLNRPADCRPTRRERIMGAVNRLSSFLPAVPEDPPGASYSVALGNLLSKYRLLCSLASEPFRDAPAELKVARLNSMLFLLIDSLLGRLLLVWAERSAGLLERGLALVRRGLLVERFAWLLHWYMRWPAGLKLNMNLNRFLGELYLWLLGWREFLGSPPDAAVAAALRSAASVFGASTAISLAIDALNLLALHLHFMRFLAAKMFRLHWRALRSLFRLLKGVKWNTLRQRYDSADYGTDQFLLGTLLFTLLAFLLETVFVYAATFSVSCWLVFGACSVGRLLSACIETFPYAQCIAAARGALGGEKTGVPHTIRIVHSRNAPESETLQYFELVGKAQRTRALLLGMLADSFRRVFAAPRGSYACA